MKKLMALLSLGARNVIPKSTGIARTAKFRHKNPKSTQTLPTLSSNFFIQCKKNTNYSTTKRPGDEYLLQVLQSEISYEQSNQTYQEEAEMGLLGPFELESDPQNSQDVVLRRTYDHEEIAITALLDSQAAEIGVGEFEETDIYPRAVLMKVCITKPGISPVLQFDFWLQGYGNDVVIERVSYHESPQSLQPSKYRGPAFSSLDYELQETFKEFLEARGIDIDLANFLIIHLHKKEQQQYVEWLHSLESLIKKGLESG
eukprot:Gb_27592 [translate_table: standard]